MLVNQTNVECAKISFAGFEFLKGSVGYIALSKGLELGIEEQVLAQFMELIVDSFGQHCLKGCVCYYSNDSDFDDKVRHFRQLHRSSHHFNGHHDQFLEYLAVLENAWSFPSTEPIAS
jgi:hypothetical protein